MFGSMFITEYRMTESRQKTTKNKCKTEGYRQLHYVILLFYVGTMYYRTMCYRCRFKSRPSLWAGNCLERGHHPPTGHDRNLRVPNLKVCQKPKTCLPNLQYSLPQLKNHPMAKVSTG